MFPTKSCRLKLNGRRAHGTRVCPVESVVHGFPGHSPNPTQPFPLRWEGLWVGRLIHQGQLQRVHPHPPSPPEALPALGGGLGGGLPARRLGPSGVRIKTVFWMRVSRRVTGRCVLLRVPFVLVLDASRGTAGRSGVCGAQDVTATPYGHPADVEHEHEARAREEPPSDSGNVLRAPSRKTPRVFQRHSRAWCAPVGGGVPGQPAAAWLSICVHLCASVVPSGSPGCGSPALGSRLRSRRGRATQAPRIRSTRTCPAR